MSSPLFGKRRKMGKGVGRNQQVKLDLTPIFNFLQYEIKMGLLQTILFNFLL